MYHMYMIVYVQKNIHIYISYIRDNRTSLHHVFDIPRAERREGERETERERERCAASTCRY